MKIVTLTIIVTLAMLLFTGEYNAPDRIAKATAQSAEAPTFSEVSDTTGAFASAEALKTYIKMASPSVQVYFYTKKYCKKFHVPESVAFGVLKLEVTYEGPSKHRYAKKQISTGNARGWYQIVPSTGKDMYVLLGLGKRSELTADRLLHDTELNVMLGVFYLSYLHDKVSSNWKVVCGFYNTGYKQVNSYASTAAKYM